MGKKMQKRVLRVMGIWKGKQSESVRWIHGHGRKKKEDIDKWIG